MLFRDHDERMARHAHGNGSMVDMTWSLMAVVLEPRAMGDFGTGRVRFRRHVVLLRELALVVPAPNF
jgi:hypothetical protein